MRLLLTALGLATAALGAAGWWWWRDHAWWQPPPVVLPQLPALAPWTPEVAEPPRAALERPLLWSSRRPPPPPRQPSEEDRLLEEINRATLIAVVQSGPRQVAILRLASGALVRYGEASTPWRLAAFDGRVARFVSVGGLQTTRPLAPVNTRPSSGR